MLCYAMLPYGRVWYGMCYGRVWYGYAMLSYAMDGYAMLCYGRVYMVCNDHAMAGRATVDGKATVDKVGWIRDADYALTCFPS